MNKKLSNYHKREEDKPTKQTCKKEQTYKKHKLNKT